MSESPVERKEDAAVLAQLPELSRSLAERLKALTPARVGLQRAGSSVATGEVLDFQLAHGRARDAVHASLQASSLLAALRAASGLDALLLHSAAGDRKEYLQRPDLGRKLDEASVDRLIKSERNGPIDLLIVIADGLSALAVERHAAPLLEALIPMLSKFSDNLRVGPICVVEQGRVAVGDAVAALLSAELVIVLIGERPGLSSPDSLGAYITWGARAGVTTDADRNCISNIRAEGLSYQDAALRLLHYIGEARRLRLTGVTLKDPELTREDLMLENGVTEGGVSEAEIIIG